MKKQESLLIVFENVLKVFRDAVASESINLKKTIDEEVIKDKNLTGEPGSFFRSFYQEVVKYNNLKKINKNNNLSQERRIRHFPYSNKQKVKKTNLSVILSTGKSGDWNES